MSVSFRRVVFGLVAVTLTAIVPVVAAAAPPQFPILKPLVQQLLKPPVQPGPQFPNKPFPNQQLPPNFQQPGPQVQKLIVGGYWSPTLKAQFRVEQFFLPQHGQFVGVRLTSEPAWNSPLRTLGLQAGDVITRLDGVRVDNTAQLENHYGWTNVRFIKTGSQTVRIGDVYIPSNVVVSPGPNWPNGNAP
ncbi:MAG: hypothetical protein QM811_30740 [Pirellulales bacterium]